VLSLDRIGCVGDVDSRFEESSPQQAGQRLVWGLFFDKTFRLQLLEELYVDKLDSRMERLSSPTFL